MSYLYMTNGLVTGSMLLQIYKNVFPIMKHDTFLPIIIGILVLWELAECRVYRKQKLRQMHEANTDIAEKMWENWGQTRYRRTSSLALVVRPNHVNICIHNLLKTFTVFNISPRITGFTHLPEFYMHDVIKHSLYTVHTTRELTLYTTTMSE